MIVNIMGRRWSMCFVRMKNQSGLCDSPDTPGKKIRIERSLTGQELLTTVIHEALHAAAWHLDEEIVDEFSTDVATILWRLGYRREGECESES